jgi:protein O-mannosyl-transferase
MVLLAMYANSFKGAFVFDDGPNIVDNYRVHLESLDRESLGQAMLGLRGGIDRPLAYLSFGLNHYAHGLDVLGYHLVNFLIHLLTAMALYLLILRTLRLPLLGGGFADRDRAVAFLAVLLWSTSPMQVTAVTYIVQRMASMAALFFILAMLFWLLGRTTPGLYRKAAWFGLCLLSGLISLGFKENAAMLPVTLYLFDLLLIQGVTRQNLIRHLRLAVIPLAILTVLAFALADPVRIITGGGFGGREFTMLERFMTQPRILVFYLSQMVYPIPERFTLVHEIQLSTSLFQPWTTLPAMGFWLGWLGLGLYLAARKPLMAFCLLFFLVNHVVESTILPLELIYEHRNYMPSMTLYLLAALGIVALIRDYNFKPLLHKMVVASVVVVVLVHGHAVIQRNALFADPLLLWGDNVLKAPGLSRVHVNLGNELHARGMIDEAAQAYTTAIKVNRHHRRSLRALPLNNLGVHHLRLGNVEQAHEYMRQAVVADPKMIKARIGLVVVLLARQELDEAQDFLEKTLEIAPDNLNLLTLQSLIRLRQDDYQGAISTARIILRNHPVPSPIYKILGETYRRLGDYAQSRHYWEEYARTFPEDLEPGLALLQLADQLNDHELLRRAAIHLVASKGERRWEDVFELLDQLRRVNDLVISGNPRELVPLIRKGMGGERAEG